MYNDNNNNDNSDNNNNNSNNDNNYWTCISEFLSLSFVHW